MKRTLSVGVGILLALVLVWLLVAALLSAAGIQTGASALGDAGARLALLAA